MSIESDAHDTKDYNLIQFVVRTDSALGDEALAMAAASLRNAPRPRRSSPPPPPPPGEEGGDSAAGCSISVVW